MKSKAGIVCILLGIALLFGSLLLAMSNMRQETAAQNAVVEIMPQLVQQIQTQTATAPTVEYNEVLPDLELQVPVELLTEEDKKMTEVEIDGYRYIGYVTIPALDLNLPIMSDWSYKQLNISPCRYYGSIRGEDLVLMAHNYTYHFGRISRLEVGDLVLFTDMDGGMTEYAVVGMDIVDPRSVDVVTAGEFDLVLFTCTYGGGSRVVVYCNRL